MNETTITFTFAADPRKTPEGGTVIHMHISVSDGPGENIRAVNKAVDLVRQIIHGNGADQDDWDEEKLLTDEPPRDGATIIFRNFVHVAWDRRKRIATYRKGDFERVDFSARYNKVCEIAMELRDYTYRCLKKHERKEGSGNGQG